MDEKVEENMGTIVGIKLSMNYGETNVDTPMNVKKKGTQTWMQKGGKLGWKKGCKHGPNMGAIVDTKLVAKLDESKVDVKVYSKWDAKNINNIWCKLGHKRGCKYGCNSGRKCGLQW